VADLPTPGGPVMDCEATVADQLLDTPTEGLHLRRAMQGLDRHIR